MPRPARPRSLLLRSPLLLLPLLLASCGGDDCWDCAGYSPPPCIGCVPPGTQVSLGLVAGDFAGNGQASVIATSTVLNAPQGNPGNLAIYLSTAPGTYAAAVTTADGDDPLYLASADLNGDHLPDVVSASATDGTLSVFLNNAQSPGTFATPVVLSSPGASQVAIADMNGDGLPDLVSADYNVSLFLQSAPGVFANPIGLYSGGANWVAVGDLNGDGIPDVALTDAVGVKLLMHTGAAGATTYAAPVAIFSQSPNPSVYGANLIAIADVNGDGLNDLVITDPGPIGNAAPTVSVLLQDPNNHGQFLAPVSYPIATYSSAQSIIVTDVDGDGRPDIVIGGSTAVSVLLQSSTTAGTFLPATSYPVQNANEIAVADVNGDGHPDIILGTGPSQPAVNGMIPNAPGVLLQNAASPGTFGSLQALP
ncbi:MAG TPA: VCBS repeat-containing protein [Steroidobacteraceae bacterium]|nr:VCBS repeat-containing protein [Steroidobacteraceae bacterium]